MAAKVPINYASYLSRRALRYKPSAIRKLIPFVGIPGMISLAGGLPNPDLFPIKNIELELTNGNKVNITDKKLSSALQYSSSFGLPDFLTWLKEFQIKTHSPALPSSDWGICVTTGSQDGLQKTMDMLLNEGDNLLVEEPCYSGTLAALRPLDLNVVGVKTDGNGIIPENLEEILSSWPKSSPKPRPRVLYTIPTGQNPSGATLAANRRLHLLEVARKFELLVLEDDPYYHVHYSPSDRPKSLFQLDEDGRVLRFDSLSKVMSSGMRIGWVTGPNYLVERLQLIQQASTMHASGLSQSIAHAVLESLGEEGLESHLEKVREVYGKRRDVFCGLVEKYLKGKVEYTIPEAGMFVWFKLNGIEDSLDLIQQKAMEAKVLLVPGSAFYYDERPNPYVRAAFSIATEEEMEQGIQRLSSILSEAN